MFAVTFNLTLLSLHDRYQALLLSIPGLILISLIASQTLSGPVGAVSATLLSAITISLSFLAQFALNLNCTKQLVLQNSSFTGYLQGIWPDIGSW